jgi:hypothetical protein
MGCLTVETAVPPDVSVHDKKIADAQSLRLSAGITLWQDAEFLGHNPENVTVKMPKKAQRQAAHG